MKSRSNAKLLRIFIGEADKIGHVAAYEIIVLEARKMNLAGATVYKGVMGYGGKSRVHSAKFLDISQDLPLVVEIVDTEENIEAFLPFLEKLFDEHKLGGLVTMEKAEIIKYTFH